MMEKDDIKRVVRGPNDLEEIIKKLEKQKEFLKFQCKKAGARIKWLELNEKTLKKDIDRLFEENSNLKTIMKGEK